MPACAGMTPAVAISVGLLSWMPACTDMTVAARFKLAHAPTATQHFSFIKAAGLRIFD
jgi:hypothetical protein